MSKYPDIAQIVFDVRAKFFEHRAGRTPTKYDQQMADEIGAAILAAGYRKPRTITTVEELDALAVGSVVHSSAGTIACRLDGERGVVFGMSLPFPWKNLAVPAIVLHDPSDGAQ